MTSYDFGRLLIFISAALLFFCCLALLFLDPIFDIWVKYAFRRDEGHRYKELTDGDWYYLWLDVESGKDKEIGGRNYHRYYAYYYLYKYLKFYGWKLRYENSNWMWVSKRHFKITFHNAYQVVLNNRNMKSDYYWEYEFKSWNA